jgi:6-phosphogluconolactonase
MLTVNEFTDFASLSTAISTKWLSLVVATPENQPCSFALAGGSTPAPLYRQFDGLFAAAKTRAIQLLATDERWVPDSDPQSNEGLFRQCFASSSAHWNLVSLKNNQPSPAAAVADIDVRLKEECPFPFTAVILGMGTDGHIASLFPDAPQLLTKDIHSSCVAALNPATQQARMSLSFARLLNTKAIWLVITGAEKRAVLELAAKTHAGPIGALLAAARVEVFWCP